MFGKIQCLNAVLLAAVLAAAASAQGGKAEPNRINFAKGSSSATVRGTLSNAQEMEYVFNARAGQTVTVRNANPRLFDIRVFNDIFEFETEFDSSAKIEFEVPQTGDYLMFVRRKVGRPRTAAFAVTITIK
jgi:hypothetical protein